MFSTLSWEIFILGKIARCMFCIIKSNFIVSCNTFSKNREKLGDYLTGTDYACIINIDPLIVFCKRYFSMLYYFRCDAAIYCFSNFY